MISYVGCSGYYYKEWKNIFYPPGLPTKDYFSFYATCFNTVELNSTFYHLPTSKNVHLWYKQAPQNFKFSLKVSRYITHIKKFKSIKDPLKQVYGLSDILGEKIGYFLFQFPHSFSFTDERLERILSQLDPNYKNVLEFRHQSWWLPQVINDIKLSNTAFCSVKGFHLPEDLMISNHRIYLRLHGDSTYSSSYSQKELSQLAQEIKTAHLKETWVYFNNTQYGYAVQNALGLAKIINNSKSP